jgi:hypothetical protein
MVKKTPITTCEKELAKIKIKAEKRHQIYMKNKKPKGPSKADVIIALKAQVEELKHNIKAEAEAVIEQEPEAVAEPEPEPEPEPVAEPEQEPEPEEEAVAEPEKEPEPEEEAVEEEVVVYDNIYNEPVFFEVDNPLIKTEKTCQYKESIYTLDFIEGQINELSWKTDAIRETVFYSVNAIFPLMENPHLPTCIVCLEKLVDNLDYVETDNVKKKVYFQCLMVLIRRVDVELERNVIEKYTQIYETYKYMALNYRD